MIAYLSGTLVEKQPTRVVIETGGIGYEVFIPLNTFDKLPSAGEICRLRIYENIREEAYDLYGFATDQERDLFLLLITVQGVGPKVAMTVLSGISPRDLVGAIANGDTARLKAISGIGKAKADLIVATLKNKISAADQLAASVDPAIPEQRSAHDAVLALITLGYKQEEAKKLVTAVLEKDPQGKLAVEDIIRKAIGR